VRPTGSRVRVCYFVQSHQYPAQLARLVATLTASSPGALVVVGHDSTTCRLTRDDLPPSPDIQLFHPPGPVERGRLSMVSPYLQAIDRLRDQGADYDWLVYLSGQDYPTQPLPTLNGLQSLAHVHLVYGPLIGLRARRTPWRKDRACYAGKQWLTVRRACAEFLAGQVRRESELLAYYARCICPDESLFQTLLGNSGKFRLADDDLRYADFAGSRDGRPRVLGESDFETITNPRFHFARKFDAASDERILDRLDDRIFAGARS